MRAGRELDALVAEKIFGGKVYWPESGKEPWVSTPGTKETGIIVPHYSTDKEKAWKVFDRIWSIGGDTLGTFIELSPAFQARELIPGRKTPIMGEEASAEEICIAALKAVGAL